MLSRRNLTLSGLGVALAATGLRRSPATAAEQFPVSKPEAEWKAELTPAQYDTLRGHGTERPGSSPFDKIYAAGEYRCAGCGQPLFSSETKYDSGTGWPSFYTPFEKAVGFSTDHKLASPRTEVHCSRCGGHLGHVFDDGPPPTGKRYCMNGVAMTFTPHSEK
ncbi:peptide-methionine (R)-S-oxide reductase MsrB [Hyphomicrobium sp.]|uniref:peptide-methionine (R)-S-oxide reductase MsrB n=1 Tax=Hyphomicrobium sp. TaxID=82 RepID=UPI002E3305AF|nr:peptide-methionine (R)-S-oxide reductase MsrB [Hyphomicrobium sp.]HEX2842643.1 peptide-methionine (R)-S-oxide reductase MsrB [Hyphomicrobium sp.]